MDHGGCVGTCLQQNAEEAAFSLGVRGRAHPDRSGMLLQFIFECQRAWKVPAFRVHENREMNLLGWNSAIG